MKKVSKQKSKLWDYSDMIPKNKKYKLDINIDLYPKNKNYKYHFELTLPTYYESSLEKLGADLKKKYKIIIGALKMRFPNSSLIFYSKTKDDIKKFIVDYLKFINSYSYKEAKAYPDIIYLNMIGPNSGGKTSF
jgi:hypothetical protein